MKVEIVRELRQGKNQACILRRDGEFFVMHNIAPPRDAPSAERPGVLVFASDSKGVITDWREVAGGPGISRGQAIAELEQ